MNNEKFKKSLDEIKPSQALINKTLMNIKEKKKVNYFMPFYMASLVAVCSIILITTYIINDNSTTTNSINNHFLIEIKGEYTFEHIFDFNKLPKEDLKNMYVLKHGDKLEDNDYNIPYEHYEKFMEMIQPLKENKINTLKEFKEENYDRIVINDEKYLYVSNDPEEYELVFYDKTNQVYYQIEIPEEQRNTIIDIQLYVIWFSRMSSKENFIDQTKIKNVKQTTFFGIYLVEKTNRNGEWESYMRTKEYSDYQELMTYIEKFRYNKVTKYIDNFDVSKYYGNMLIQFEGTYIYIPETVNGKILLYQPNYSSNAVHTIYYEIELQQRDYSTLESIKNIIKTRGVYESAYGMYIPGTQTLVDSYVNESRIINVWRDIGYAKAWIKGGNNLYITLKPYEIKNNKYEPMDISKIENNSTFLIKEHVRSYTLKGMRYGYYNAIVYVTDDKRVEMVKISDIVKTGNVNPTTISVNGPVKTLEETKDENNFIILNAVLEDGTKVKIDI